MNVSNRREMDEEMDEEDDQYQTGTVIFIFLLKFNLKNLIVL